MDATWGGQFANSYVSVTDASSFLTTAVVDSAAWTNATTVAQRAALLEATRDIDTLQFVGTRYYSHQNLEMPREIVQRFPYGHTETGSTAFSVEFARMQDRVKQSCCHQALWILRNSGRNYHLENIASGVRSYSERVGPIGESAQYNTSVSRLCPEAKGHLQPYIADRRIVRG